MDPIDLLEFSLGSFRVYLKKSRATDRSKYQHHWLLNAHVEEILSGPQHEDYRAISNIEL